MADKKLKLKIDMDDLETAFEQRDNLLEITCFLDLATGEVVTITVEERNLLDTVYEEYGNPETGEVDWPTVLPLLDVADWQQETLLAAHRVESDDTSRYLGIPQDESHDGYQDMVAFIETVGERRLQDHLERAISHKGAFRSFKDVLLDYPNERKRWFLFEHERKRQRMLDWLEEKGIELI